ncbi:9925_t:CDS:2 [Ambispora leptoticha]|uniref:9925_t:CDS:1 n=1 Tax=Ambispora leptoticha TaxID=144679 RepID=A0A9N8Z9Y2_9GLOM|nr:9925_t:CDS:2 [Ambispora leptoticha]
MSPKSKQNSKNKSTPASNRNINDNSKQPLENTTATSQSPLVTEKPSTPPPDSVLASANKDEQIGAENVNKNPYIDVVQKRLRALNKRHFKNLQCEEMLKNKSQALNQDQIQALERKNEIVFAMQEFELIIKNLNSVESEQTDPQNPAPSLSQQPQNPANLPAAAQSNNANNSPVNNSLSGYHQQAGKGRAIDVEVEEESNGQSVPISLPTPPPEIISTTKDGASNSPETHNPREERGATTTNGTSQVATEYHLKAIEWFDITTGNTKRLKVITQNGNVLILRGDIEIKPYDRPSITYELLVEILGDYLWNSISKGEAEMINKTNKMEVELQQQSQNKQPSSSSSSSERSTEKGVNGLKSSTAPGIQPSIHDYHHTLNAALSIIPSLQTGLDVNVKFNSIFGFEHTAELSVFDVFNVDLVHGWVVDPQDQDTWDVVVGKCGSYNRAVECVVRGDETSKGLVVESLDNGAGVGNSANASGNGAFNADERDALIVSQFLHLTATQLTYHGLQTLAEDLQPGHLCVLFRNNHFSTLYKHPGTSSLYVLVTDAGFVNERSVVWETLTDVDQSNSEFLNAQFLKGKVVADYVDLTEEPHDSTGGGDQDGFRDPDQQQSKQGRQQQSNGSPSDNISHSSIGSSIDTGSGSSSEKERRKKEKSKKKNDCVIS